MSMFETLFRSRPTVTAEACGRVNLIGEHTDYNGGYVLPTLIPQRTRVELTGRPDHTVHVASANQAGGLLSYTLGAETPGRGWLDYVQGLTCVLTAEHQPLHGFDAFITSEVPLGSGLSSSAALSVSLLRALRSAFALQLDDLQLALLGQRSENEFVGAHVGVMDPMVCSLAELGTALFIDTRNLTYQRVPLPRNADLVVINSGVAHDHAAGDYNTRRAECERACALLGVERLSELSLGDLPRLKSLPDPLDRRARHVITENARVLAVIEALRNGNLERVGHLFYASHASQRDDYVVSIPAIDLLVELAHGDPAVYGARLTGGGFGGSVVMFTHAEEGALVADRIARAYVERSGNTPSVLVPARL